MAEYLGKLYSFEKGSDTDEFISFLKQNSLSVETADNHGLSAVYTIKYSDGRSASKMKDGNIVVKDNSKLAMLIKQYIESKGLSV
jgi:hypothetical protein